MHCACSFFILTAIEPLIYYGADIDMVDNDGRTPLRSAQIQSIRARKTETLQLLASCGKTRLEASLTDWIRLAQRSIYMQYTDDDIE